MLGTSNTWWWKHTRLPCFSLCVYICTLLGCLVSVHNYCLYCTRSKGCVVRLKIVMSNRKVSFTNGLNVSNGVQTLYSNTHTKKITEKSFAPIKKNIKEEKDGEKKGACAFVITVQLAQSVQKKQAPDNEEHRGGGRERGVRRVFAAREIIIMRGGKSLMSRK